MTVDGAGKEGAPMKTGKEKSQKNTNRAADPNKPDAGRGEGRGPEPSRPDAEKLHSAVYHHELKKKNVGIKGVRTSGTYLNVR